MQHSQLYLIPKRRKNIGIIIGGLALILTVVVLLNIFQGVVRPVFYFISSPFQKFFWQAGENTASFCSSFINAGSLKQQTIDLVGKNQALIAENEKLKVLSVENETLRQALSLNLQKDFKLTVAQVIGKDISQDILQIDRGSADGIFVNMPVLSSQKILVGKVIEVYKHFSKVMLISSKKMSFDAAIQNKKINGLIRGLGNLQVIFELIPREKDIAKGDVIATSALGGVFPAGIPVGEVKEVKKNDVDTFQQISVTLYSNFNDLNFLFLIQK